MKNLFLTVLLFSALCGCRPQPQNDATSLPKPVEQFRSSQTNLLNLTESEVLKMAVDLAKQKKLNLNDYKSPTIDFDSIKKDWWVSFDHKPPGYPGGHFVIRVNDKTRKVDFFPGE